VEKSARARHVERQLGARYRFPNCGEIQLSQLSSPPPFRVRVLSFVAALIVATDVAATEPPTELEIKTTFLPQDCYLKAQTGDSIQVHYVCAQWTFNWNKN
jgi:hypothetical protein